MDDLTQRSKVKLNYELPDEVVEDYTYEMGRLKFKVNTRYCLCFCEHFTRMTGIDTVHCSSVNGACGFFDKCFFWCYLYDFRLNTTIGKRKYRSRSM